MRICLDPGHGMGNVQRGTFDSGAVAGGVREADVALDWARLLRTCLRSMGHTVVLTRRDNLDPAPVSRRDDIALSYRCDLMISLHCNWGGGRATGTEVFYRGAEDLAFASALSHCVSSSLLLPNRGAKTEAQSQHKRLAVLEFQRCWLIELGFIDHVRDRAAMCNAGTMARACADLAQLLSSYRP